MSFKIERRQTPDVPRPEHGQRRGDKLAAQALAGTNPAVWWQHALPLWTAAAFLGALVGFVLLRN